MGRSTGENRVSLKVRVTTRLAWLDMTQQDFARAIGMDKSVLSRAMRADAPRGRTMQRIALGLGLRPEDLSIEADPVVLVTDHPALDRVLSRSDRAENLQAWYKQEVTKLPLAAARHRTEEERHCRRMEVRKALEEDQFGLEFVRALAKKYGVSTSQIFADRTRIISLTKILDNGGSGDDAPPG